MTARHLLDEITTLTRRMRTVFDTQARQKGLTLARARIILRLKRAGAGETQKALAEELEIEAPTLVRLLDSLEDAGTIVRIAVDGDRRAKAVQLTGKGERQADDVDEVLAAYRAGLVEGISQADLNATLRVIRQMQANLEHMA